MWAQLFDDPAALPKHLLHSGGRSPHCQRRCHGAVDGLIAASAASHATLTAAQSTFTSLAPGSAGDVGEPHHHPKPAVCQQSNLCEQPERNVCTPSAPAFPPVCTSYVVEAVDCLHRSAAAYYVYGGSQPAHSRADPAGLPCDPSLHSCKLQLASQHGCVQVGIMAATSSHCRMAACLPACLPAHSPLRTLMHYMVYALG